MKFLFALALIASPAFAASNRSTCNELLANAATSVKLVQARFSIGEVTRTDVDQALLSQLELRFECRDVLAKDYCEAAPALADELVELIRAEARGGQADTLQVLAAERRAIEAKGFCR